jgi:hypothetical protein
LATGIACLFVLWLGGCGLPSGRPYSLRVFSESIDLTWDPPASTSLLSGQEISCYYVYLRKQGIGGWRLVGQVPASSNPVITLRISDCGIGEFDFAVSAATSKGVESRLHASFDASADPTGGWYLIWYP